MSFTISSAEIAKTELALNAVFPDSFKEVMMVDNGGVFEIDEESEYVVFLYPFADSTDIKTIKRTMNSITYETKELLQHAEVPQNAIAIGDDGAGYIFFLVTDKNNLVQDEVFVWSSWDHSIEKYQYGLSELLKVKIPNS